MEERKVWVIGHKNPDTDSICAAITYSYLKNQTIEEEQKKEQDGKAGKIDDPAVFSATVQIILLTGREFIHFDSAPPI